MKENQEIQEVQRCKLNRIPEQSLVKEACLFLTHSVLFGVSFDGFTKLLERQDYERVVKEEK